MEKPQIKSPQVEGLKNFLVHLPYQFEDYEIRDLSANMEFRRIAHAIKMCHKTKDGNVQADKYNYSCIARTICPTVSKQFIECWRQAQQVNPNLTCEIQRRGVEVCVGEHVSQAISTIDAGSLAAGVSCFDIDETMED